MNLYLPTHMFAAAPHAYLVGGSVRDYLMGHHPMDFDLAVTGNALVFAESVARHIQGHLIELGKGRFSLYRIVKNKMIIDVAPSKGPSIESDLKDRDFTINALACNLASGRIIDTVGGLDDLNRMIVRMTSANIFEADPIRLLRAHRLALCLGMQITSDTQRAISDHAWRIQRSAGERVWGELKLIFAHPDSHTQLSEMAATGVLEAVFPELSKLKACTQNRFHDSDVWQHCFKSYQALEALIERPAAELPHAGRQFVKSMTQESTIVLKLSILLHDIGKPACRTVDQSGQAHFYGHAFMGALPTRHICKRLRLSKRQSDLIEFVVKHHQWPMDLFLAQQGSKSQPLKAMGRFLRKCGPYTPLLLLHAMADCLGKTERTSLQQRAFLDFIRRSLALYFDKADKPDQRPLLDGNDLQDRFALAPSPLIGELLRLIEEARLSGRIQNQKQALQMAADYLAEKQSRPLS